MRRYVGVSRKHAEYVFKVTDLMEINLWLAMVYASQTDVNVNLAVTAFELILVTSSATELTVRNGSDIQNLVYDI